MNSIFDGLLEFPTQSEFDTFIEKLDKETAIKLIELSIVSNQQKGVYSLEESYCLYRCLNELKKSND